MLYAAAGTLTGFKRIRHYGLLAPAHKTQRVALSAPAPEPAVIESVAAFLLRIERAHWNACPHCGHGHFVVTAPLPPTPAAHAPPFS